jgi:Tol biopolymer transport system component
VTAAAAISGFLLSNKAGVGTQMAPSPKPRTRASPTSEATSPANPDVAIVFASRQDGRYHLHVINLDGTGESALTSGTTEERTPAWSPTRDRIAFARSMPGAGLSGEMDIYVMAADGSNVRRLTGGPANDEDPAWSPDGTRIAFTSSDRSTGRTRIRMVGLDGMKAPQLPPPPTGCIDREPAWSPDGTTIAFARDCGQASSSLFVIDTDGTGLRQVSGFGRTPDWSPDGSKIAYTGWGREGPAIFIINADGTETVQLTTDGSGDPVWSPDGLRIAFTAGGLALKLFVIDVDGRNERPLTDGTADEGMPAW